MREQLRNKRMLPYGAALGERLHGFQFESFLYMFLPPILFLHTFFLAAFRSSVTPANLLLLVASISLYYWGNGPSVIPLVFTILTTAFAGKCITQTNGSTSKAFLFAGCGLNLAVLFYYKYFHFTVGLLLPQTNLASVTQEAASGVENLPVGISFYTFMAMKV